MTNEYSEAREWKEAVIDALILNWALTSENEHNPRKAVSDLQAAVQMIALDPLVSEAAQKLIDDALERAAQWIEHAKDEEDDCWESQGIRSLKGKSK